MNISSAKKLIKKAKTPHERDLARMRLNILKKAQKKRKEKDNERI